MSSIFICSLSSQAGRADNNIKEKISAWCCGPVSAERRRADLSQCQSESGKYTVYLCLMIGSRLVSPAWPWLARSQSPEFYYKEARASQAGLCRLWARTQPPLYTHTLGIVTFKPKLQIDFARSDTTIKFKLKMRFRLCWGLWVSFSVGSRPSRVAWKRPGGLRGSAARN